MSERGETEEGSPPDPSASIHRFSGYPPEKVAWLEAIDRAANRLSNMTWLVKSVVIAGTFALVGTAHSQASWLLACAIVVWIVSMWRLDVLFLIPERRFRSLWELARDDKAPPFTMNIMDKPTGIGGPITRLAAALRRRPAAVPEVVGEDSDGGAAVAVTSEEADPNAWRMSLRQETAWQVAKRPVFLLVYPPLLLIVAVTIWNILGRTKGWQ